MWVKRECLGSLRKEKQVMLRRWSSAIDPVVNPALLILNKWKTIVM